MCSAGKSQKGPEQIAQPPKTARTPAVDVVVAALLAGTRRSAEAGSRIRL
jgi:hypothetical protein